MGLRLSSVFHPQTWSHTARLAHALRDVPLFRDVPTRNLVSIWRCLEGVRLPRGVVVCRRGAPGDCFYIVQSGVLEVRLGLRADGITLRQLRAGDHFGEMALLTGEPRSADVIVVEDAVLWLLRKDDFDALCARSVPLLRALNRTLCRLVNSLTLAVEGRREIGAARWRKLRYGPYRVVAQLGAGGDAVVYACVHAKTGEAAAVKALPVGRAKDSETHERLAREAAFLQQVHHPNVVRLLEVGEVEERFGDGTYLAMEWVPNALDCMLRAQYPEPLQTETAIRIALGIAFALAAVHAAGIVHRDVKPSNVLLRADGSPALTDFGLAITNPAPSSEAALDPATTVVGSADYMSPEQVRGESLDGRSDVYGLGVVLYQMLTGSVPFAGRAPAETMRAQCREAPPPLPASVPAEVRHVVERALQKKREARFGAAEMAEALATILDRLGGSHAERITTHVQTSGEAASGSRGNRALIRSASHHRLPPAVPLTAPPLAPGGYRSASCPPVETEAALEHPGG